MRFQRWFSADNLTSGQNQISLLMASGALSLMSLFIHLGWTGFIADSEIWTITSAFHYFDDWYQPWVATRSMFYLPLSLLTHCSGSSVGIFQSAKVMGIGVGLAIIVLTYLVGKELSSPKLTSLSFVPWAAPILLLGHQGFLGQGYRVRPDLLACVFTMTSLWLYLRQQTTPSHLSRVRRLAPLLFLILAFLCTPKAILQILPMLAFAPHSANKKWWRRSASGYVVAVVGLMVLWPLYRPSLRYFLDSLSSGTYERPLRMWFEPEAYYYLWKMLGQSPLFNTAFVMRFLTLSMRLRHNVFGNANERRIALQWMTYCLLAAVVMLLAPEKYPFFLATLLVPMSIFAALLIEDLWVLRNHLFTAYLSRVINQALPVLLAFALAAQILSGLSFYQLAREEDNVYPQFELVEYLESYLRAYPKAQYYDVIGTIPRRATYRHFVGPNDYRARAAALYSIEQRPPQLIFYTNKMATMEPEISQRLHHAYFALGQGAYALWRVSTVPLRIDADHRDAIASFVAEAQQDAGGESAKLHFEIRASTASQPTVVECSIDELFANYQNSVITKASPFLLFENAPAYQIQSQFRFDATF